MIPTEIIINALAPYPFALNTFLAILTALIIIPLTLNNPRHPKQKENKYNVWS